MKKNLLFSLLAVFLAGFGFGGSTMAGEVACPGASESEESGNQVLADSSEAVAKVEGKCYSDFSEGANIAIQTQKNIELLTNIETPYTLMQTGDVLKVIKGDFNIEIKENDNIDKTKYVFTEVAPSFFGKYYTYRYDEAKIRVTINNEDYYFGLFNKAFDSVKNKPQSVITLLEKMGTNLGGSVYSDYIIDENYNIIIDLSSKTIDRKGKSFKINGGSLESKNGTFNATSTSTPIFYIVSGDLKIDDITLNSTKYPAIATKGDISNNATISLGNNTNIVTQNAPAIYLPGKENISTIVNSKITGTTAIEIRAGKLIINESTELKATGTFSAAPNGNGSTINGAALAISQHTTNLPINVIINGGKFEGEYALYEEDLQDEEATDDIQITILSGLFKGKIKSENVTKFIQGGKFSEKPDDSYIADGYYAKPIQEESYLFEITPIQEISTIELTGVVTPVSGDTLTIDGISTTTTGITLTTMQWQDNNNNQNVAMNEGDKFAKGNPYTLYIEFSVDEGYKLANEVSCGESCTVTAGESSNSLRLTYTAEAKKYTVTWDIEGQKATTEVEEGSTPTYTGTPTKAADNSYTYSFSGWSLDGKNVVDLSSQQITSDVTYTAIFTATKKTTSTGGGGGGGGGSSSSYSCKNLPENAVANNTKKPSSRTDYFYDTDTSKVCSFVCKEGYEWNKTSSKCEAITTITTTTTTGDNTKIDEQKPEENKNDTTANPQETLSDGLTTELHDAYDFAHKYGITTMPSAAEANMYSQLNRIAMAKMLSQYAINVLGKTPDTSKVVPTFSDITPELNQEYSDAVTLAYQLGIMGINIEEFRPFDPVIRAEFATALSRLLFATPDGEYEGTAQYYVNHLAKLVEEKIITNNDPLLNELRGYVMIMLMRSAQ